MDRKPIPKSVRFEVLKRDSFTCQYCGRSAPDVILELDHIIPVSKGGDDSIMNLVAACRDCNRGKTNRDLSDDTAVKKQKRQLDEIQERREQLQMMVEWRNALLKEQEEQINAVEDLIRMWTGYGLNDYGRQNFRRYIKRFGFSEVLESTEISLDRYYHDEDDFGKTMYKVGGICYNRKKAREANAEQDN